jgi:hypothetical protein
MIGETAHVPEDSPRWKTSSLNQSTIMPALDFAGRLIFFFMRILYPFIL